MDLAGHVINAVLVEGKSLKEVCTAHDISRSWLYELIARYRQSGDEGLRPESKRPHSSPTRVSAAIEEEIVALRKELTDLGVDAGAHTIHYHLQRRHRRRRRAVPSVATIWRVLSRRGFVSPNPTSGPRAPGGASPPSCPTNAGRPMSPTGPWRTATTSRSSTSLTTTPAYWSPPGPLSPPKPPTWSKPSTRAPPSWVCRPPC